MLNARSWGDPACRWRAIPSEEKDIAINQLKGKSALLFAERGHTDMSSVKVESAIRDRLQAARRNWSRARRPVNKKPKNHDQWMHDRRTSNAANAHISGNDKVEDRALNEQLVVVERRTAMDIASMLCAD